MQLLLDPKYQLAHTWYEQLTGAFHKVLQEPTAQGLHFKPEEKRIIVEIGIYEGASSCWWSDNLLEHPESRLYCIDPFLGNIEYQQARENFPTLDQIEYTAKSNIAKSKHPGKVTVLKGASWDLYPDFARTLQEQNQQIDILYIDGEHTPTAVCRDIALYAPLVRRGGAIIIDDYGHEDVRRGADGALNALNCLKKGFCTGWQLWCIKS